MKRKESEQSEYRIHTQTHPWQCAYASGEKVERITQSQPTHALTQPHTNTHLQLLSSIRLTKNWNTSATQLAKKKVSDDRWFSLRDRETEEKYERERERESAVSKLSFFGFINSLVAFFLNWILQRGTACEDWERWDPFFCQWMIFWRSPFPSSSFSREERKRAQWEGKGIRFVLLYEHGLCLNCFRFPY